MPPVPGMTGSDTIEMVGLPPCPLPLATAIWFAVPAISTPPAVVPFWKASRPVPPTCAMAEISPSSEIVGFPETPDPLAMARPVPETATERAETAPEPVFTMIPVPAPSKAPEVPLSVIWRVESAPPSTRPMPVPPESARLLIRVGS